MNDDQAPLSALRSRAEVQQALLWAVQHALQVHARKLIWVDPDFAAWPLDEPALLQSLTAWLQLPQRRLVLLAQRYDDLARAYPRFVAWRRPWAHAVDAWQPAADAEPLNLPTLCLDDGRLCLQVFDKLHWRGRLQLDERQNRQWRDEIDALLQRCTASFPAHQLGL